MEEESYLTSHIRNLLTFPSKHFDFPSKIPLSLCILLYPADTYLASPPLSPSPKWSCLSPWDSESLHSLQAHSLVCETVLFSVTTRGLPTEFGLHPSQAAVKMAVKREAKGKGEKEKYTYLNAESQRIARRDKKAFLNYMQRNRGKQ